MEFDLFDSVTFGEIKDDEQNHIIFFDGICDEDGEITSLAITRIPVAFIKSSLFRCECSIIEDIYYVNIAKKLVNLHHFKNEKFSLQIVEDTHSKKCREIKDVSMLPKLLVFDMIKSIAENTLVGFVQNQKETNDVENAKSMNFYSAIVSRRNNLEYRYSHSNICNSFKLNLIKFGEYSENEKQFGDTYYIARFEKYEKSQEFQEFVSERIPYERSKRRNKSLTGEDIDMFNERKQESSSKDKEAICDTHIDGA